MLLISSEVDAWAIAAALAREFPEVLFILSDSKFEGVATISADRPCAQAESIALAVSFMRHEGQPVLFPAGHFAPVH